MLVIILCKVFPGSSMIKNLPDNAGDSRHTDLIPGSGRSPGERNDNPLQYSCLENSMDRGECHATVHGVRKLTQLCTVESAYAHSHTLCNKYLLPSSIGIL